MRQFIAVVFWVRVNSNGRLFSLSSYFFLSFFFFLFLLVSYFRFCLSALVISVFSVPVHKTIFDQMSVTCVIHLTDAVPLLTVLSNDLAFSK